MGLSIKKLDHENWLDVDSDDFFTPGMVTEGEVAVPAGDYWLREIMSPPLNNGVPEDVQRLFETARGALAYGCFFYPLYGLGVRQFYLVLAAAIGHKCKLLSAPPSVKGLRGQVAWLAKQRAIERGEWENIVKLRDIAAHPESQSLGPPAWAVFKLTWVVGVINKLFPEAP